MQQLIKLQETVHTTERLKRIEGKLIEVLNGLPKEQQESFLVVYEEVLGSDYGRIDSPRRFFQSGLVA